MSDISDMTIKGNAPGKTTCEECGKPCNLDVEAKRQLCVKCKKNDYPKDCYNPRDYNIFGTTKKLRTNKRR